MADLTTYTVAVSAVISAPPRACDDTIADYLESYPETGVEAPGGAARVTIETRTPRGRGLRAAAERAVTRRILSGIFVAELRMLAAHVGGDILARPVMIRAG